MESKINGKKRCLVDDESNSFSKTKKANLNSNSNHWSQGLKQALKDPDSIIFDSKNCSVINDMYPKAKTHFLVVAKNDVSSMAALNQNHVSLLEEMIDIGQNLKTREQKKNPKIEFRMGFHAVPSMTRLHMHVISTDFDSPCLKNKRHWNSFTSSFFRPANDILNELKRKNCISIDSSHYKRLLENPLKCHICSEQPRNIPRLKDHLKHHFK